MADISVLKGTIPEELFTQLETAMKESKVKLADLSTGAYVGKDKFDAAESAKKAVETQIAEANKQIEAFKGMNVDQIKAEADKWKTDFEKATSEHQAELLKIKTTHALDEYLRSEKVVDPIAIKARLDHSKIKLDGETLLGVKEQVEPLKTDDIAKRYFGMDDSNGKPTFVEGTRNPQPTGNNPFSFKFSGMPVENKPK